MPVPAVNVPLLVKLPVKSIFSFADSVHVPPLLTVMSANCLVPVALETSKVPETVVKPFTWSVRAPVRNFPLLTVKSPLIVVVPLSVTPFVCELLVVTL